MMIALGCDRSALASQVVTPWAGRSVRVRIGALLALATGLSALEPLMTDLRFTGGGGQRDYDVNGQDLRFDSGLDVGLQFAWSTRELAPSGSWFFGGQGAFADRRDDDNDFALSTMTFSGIAGFAVSPQGMRHLHAELGVIGGLGLALARAGQSDSIAPWLEGGVRGGLYLTWEQLQIGVDLGYRIGLTSVDPGTGDNEAIAVRGLVAAVAIGLRIE